MFDFAWTELALIGVVALVVIGPKDLPRVLRAVGFWVGKARGIAREFQSSLDQMVREAELDDVKNQINKAARFNFEEEFNKTVDPHGDLARSLSEPVLANPLIDQPKPLTPTQEAILESEKVAPPEAAALPAPEEAVEGAAAAPTPADHEATAPVHPLPPS
jgi:sec-independent protein translocase protein TatB